MGAASLDLSTVTTILCDADGTLFPSEQPAYQASVSVTNDLASALGMSRRFEAEELRLATTGASFRTLAAELAGGQSSWGAVKRQLDSTEIDEWVEREKAVVTEFLSRHLSPDTEVRAALGRLSSAYELALVSSSALRRIDACLLATGLDGWFPADRRFSAEDSLASHASKPDPEIYRFALENLGIFPGQVLALEDSVTGASSALAAGCATVGVVCFVPAEEQDERAGLLTEAGCALVAWSWAEIVDLLVPVRATRA
jgi:beta-phosphoglucomutase-like phosphatase (HAD superfamily)